MELDDALVRKTIAERLKVPLERVTDDALFLDDLGADSVDTVDLVMDFESLYGIDISEDISENIATVGDLIEYLKRITG